MTDAFRRGFEDKYSEIVFSMYKAAQQQFDYSKAEIDTSVGNNGYSSDVPTFAYYKGEPAELRRKRFNDALKNQTQQFQKKVDDFGKQNGIQPSSKTTVGSVFRDAWGGLKDGAKLVGKGFVDTAKDIGDTVLGAGKIVGKAYGAVTGDYSMRDWSQNKQNDLNNWHGRVVDQIVNGLDNKNLLNNPFVQAGNALQRFGTAGAALAAPGAAVGMAGRAINGARVGGSAVAAANGTNATGRLAGAATKARTVFRRANTARKVVTNAGSAYKKSVSAFTPRNV